MQGIVIALIGSATALGVAWLSRRESQATRRDVAQVVPAISAVSDHVDEVHSLVNGNHSDLAARVDQLSQMIVHSGGTLPADPTTKKE